MLLAAAHDRESDRSGLRRAGIAGGAAAVVLSLLAITGGADDYMISPTPSVNAGNGANGVLDIQG